MNALGLRGMAPVTPGWVLVGVPRRVINALGNFLSGWNRVAYFVCGVFPGGDLWQAKSLLAAIAQRGEFR